MSKMLAGLAVAGAILAGLGVFLVSGPIILIFYSLLAFIAGVFFFQEYRGTDSGLPPDERRQRNLLTIGLGTAMIILGIIGVVGVTPVAGEDISTETVSEAISDPFIVGLGLVVSAAVLAYYWTRLEPDWVPYAGAAILVIAYIGLYLIPTRDFGAPTTSSFILALVCFVAVIPGVALLRSDPDA